jgi:uncharacterized membrane protein (DUF373 family)
MHYCQSFNRPVVMEPHDRFAVFSECGHRDAAVVKPLFIVTGASGSGKTDVSAPLGRAGMLSSAEERHRHRGTMTGMSASRGENPSEPASGPAESAAGSSADGFSRRQGVPAATRSIWVLEHVQDWVTVAVGAVLIALAAVLLIAGIVDFLDGSSGPISAGAPILLDRVLLVLILVEIVYTVVLSLRAHRLVAQPFIVVGLIAVVRRILFVLTPGSTTVSTPELALLIARVAVFIAGLVVVSRFEKGDD